MLDRDAGAPGRARTAIRGRSQHMLLEPSRRDALELLVSEVVTNAVQHASAPKEAPIDLTASFDECEILVTVTDGGVGSLPRVRTPRRGMGGYGLRIVDRESRRWGVERMAGTSVWFAI
jgi:anti-sigma regulatory factor (Ser/Thr protein kinase)